MLTDNNYAYTYDAWNNLVQVTAQNDADVVIGQYAFFANDMRAMKIVTNRGDKDGSLRFFYDGAEVVEERDGSENIVQQYLYGPNHIDEPVMIRGANGAYFVYQDANWNVIGLTTPGGDVAEEYHYTPYGRMVAMARTRFGDSDADGDVDGKDHTAWEATQGIGGTYDRDLDADYDGDNDAFDETAFNAVYNAAGTSVVVPNRAFSPTGNDLTSTARRLDPETGLMHYRYRAYNPLLHRFMQRDPWEYIDGPNLYEYVAGNPWRYVDPYGLGIMALIEGALDVAGFVPGLGAIPDLIHSGLDLVQGDFTGAAANALAAVPFAGDGAKAAKIANDIRKAAKKTKALKKAAKEAAEKAAKAKKAAQLPGKGKPGWTKLRGNQGWKDSKGRTWTKDTKHKDHWDVKDRKGRKIKEVDFDGNELWPCGPKNKNKKP